jgi:hypothetical protein
MKTLLHRIKHSLIFRLCYRLVCWINYPTPRERMWGMYAMGKAQGIKEALKDLPIVQVQPRQHASPVKLHLPAGEWTRQWCQMSGLLAPIDPKTDFPSWLTSGPLSVEHMTPAEIERVPTIRDLTAGLAEITEEMPAVVKLLHQKRQQERHAS